MDEISGETAEGGQEVASPLCESSSTFCLLRLTLPWSLRSLFPQLHFSCRDAQSVYKDRAADWYNLRSCFFKKLFISLHMHYLDICTVYYGARSKPAEEVRAAHRVRSVPGVVGYTVLRVHSGWLAKSRKSARGTMSPFHITHHPMLLSALSFTGRSCRKLVGTSSDFQRWHLYSLWHLFSSLYSLHISSLEKKNALILFQG